MSALLLHGMLVGIGGFAGAIARYFVSRAAAKRFQSAIPYGTLTVNLIGAFSLGVVAGAEAPDAVRLLVGTGFLGAFTTFSTLKTDSLRLLTEKRAAAFWVYLALTYTLGLALAFAGYEWARHQALF